MNNQEREDFAYAVIKARVKRNWTIATLAGEAGLAVMTVSRAETTKGPDPEKDTIVKLCTVLEIDSRPFLFPKTVTE